MIGIIEKIVLLILVAIGIITIYDARSLSKKFFSNSDRNSSVILLRIVGFIISIVAGIIIYVIK
jgi:hypothetical protein